MIGKTVSHYKILEKLGEGGMGVVYKARDTKLERFVAIKILSPHLSSDEEAVRRFIHEAKTSSSLDHAHIGTIHEVDETPDGRTFIVMAYYEGETLGERINRGDVSVEEALELISQVALGLCKAHAKGIIHRDVKPSNVIITADGEAKLVDFGLAKLAGATRLTRTGGTVGTVAYMSPEQARGDEVDARSDIWSLGVMLYELLAGRQPFRGEYETAVMYSILNVEPEPVSVARRDVPVEVENIVDKALTKDPSQRYQTMEEFLVTLEGQREQLRLGLKSRGLLRMRRKVRQRLVRISIPVVLVAVAAVLVIFFQPFEIQVRPKSKEVIARENSIVVMPFENVTDPGDANNDAYAIMSLLTTGLQESEYLQVVSLGRVYDVLRQLGKEGQRAVSREVAEQVAKRTGSNWILVGKLHQVEPNLVVSVEVSNAVTGRVRGKPANVRGDVGETLLSVVDRLKADLGKQLALPLEATEELDRSVTEVTTSSPEAYRAFVDGLQMEAKLYEEEAAKKYEEAVGYDSTFATAYAKLARLENSLGDSEKALNAIGKASALSRRLPVREKDDIEMILAVIEKRYRDAVTICQRMVKRDPQDIDAWFRMAQFYRYHLREHEKAIPCFQEVLRLDPTHSLAVCFLGYTYADVGNLEAALEQMNRYVELEPDEANAYDSRGDIEMALGRTDAAMADFKKVEEIKPGFTQGKLGIIYMFLKDYERADVFFKNMVAGAKRENIREFARMLQAYVLMYRGKLDSARQFLDDAIAADLMESNRERPDNHSHKAGIYVEKGDLRSALRSIDRAIEVAGPESDDYVPFNAEKGRILAQSGALAEARKTAELIDGIYAHANASAGFPPDHKPRYWVLRGVIDRAEGNLDSAIVHLEKATRQSAPFEFLPRLHLGLVYLESASLDQAIVELERTSRDWGLAAAYYAILAAKSHYYLAIAHERAGQKMKAIESYEEFLEIWKEADPDLKEVAEARRHLAALKGER